LLLGISLMSPSVAAAHGKKPGVPRHLHAVSVGSKQVTLAWKAPKGAKAKAYIVKYGPHRVVCHKTRCVIKGLRNGHRYTLRVAARNRHGMSAWSSRIRVTPHARKSPVSSMPSGFTRASLTPTGVDGQATLSFAVGASHGRTGTVTCSGSFTCGTNDVGTTGGSVTEPISGLADGATSRATLTYCNGVRSAAGIESCVATTVSAVTFGPIGTPTVTASASGNTVTVRAGANPNGADASVTIKNITNGSSHSCGSSASGSSFSCTWSNSGLSYSTKYSYTVTVTDASGHGRGSKTASTSATTPASPPTITLSLGASCAASSCATGGTGYVSCQNLSKCYHLIATSKNFGSNVTCRRDSETVSGGEHEYEGPAWTQTGNSTTYAAGNWVGPGYKARAVCDNGAISAWVSP